MARQYAPPQLQQARFYCEQCNHEVPFNAAICPNCKKTFHAVKCPACNHSDIPAAFSSGCPKCGYLSTRTNLKGRPGINVEGHKKKRRKGKSHDLFYPLMTILLIIVAVAILWNYVGGNSF